VGYTRKRIRVLIADDHALLRAGLRMLLEASQDIVVVGEAPDADQAVRLGRRLKPDVVLMALEAEGAGAGIVTRLARASPACRVLFLSRKQGASPSRGWLVKSATQADLVAAIRSLHQGGPTQRPSPKAAHGEVRRFLDSEISLSRREKEVLELVARGFTNREIAGKIGVGVKTVETYRSRLAEKLGLVSRADIVAYALEAGMLRPPRRKGRP
jgi:two-component system response regulator NreC